MKSKHHSFDTDLADDYGIEEAIVIHHFQHWISYNKRRNKNFIENHWWSYQTIKDIADWFSYWTEDQVRNILDRLCRGKDRHTVKDGTLSSPVLMKGNFNKSPMDRTCWYAFVDEEKFLGTERDSKNVCEAGNYPNGQGKYPNANGELPAPIPDTKTDTKKKCIVVRPEAVPEKIVHNSNSEPKKNVPTEIEKRNLFGQTVKCSKEEYCRHCVQKDKKWTLPEIELAWEMLVRYEGPVTDWIKFLDGTLRKFYIAKLTNANQEKKKCQNSQNQNSKKQTNSESEEKKRLENSKKQTSGKDMLEPPCPNSVKTGLDWIAWVRSLTGQKNLKTS